MMNGPKSQKMLNLISKATVELIDLCIIPLQLYQIPLALAGTIQLWSSLLSGHEHQNQTQSSTSSLLHRICSSSGSSRELTIGGDGRKKKKTAARSRVVFPFS